MFNRKLKKKVERLELRIKQIECEHENIRIGEQGFGVDVDLFGGRCSLQLVRELHDGVPHFSAGYSLICEDCGKIIKVVGAREKARMEYQQAKEEYNRVCGGGE